MVDTPTTPPRIHVAPIPGAPKKHVVAMRMMANDNPLRRLNFEGQQPAAGLNGFVNLRIDNK